MEEERKSGRATCGPPGQTRAAGFPYKKPVPPADTLLHPADILLALKDILLAADDILLPLKDILLVPADTLLALEDILLTLEDVLVAGAEPGRVAADSEQVLTFVS